MSVILGLIGKTLSHSFSQDYFRNKFKSLGLTGVDYLLFELNLIDELPALIKNQHGLVGFNVTVPYKESVITYLDEIDTLAKAIGAVNAVAVRDGNTFGTNTDILGFGDLMRNVMVPDNSEALILGTGGSSKAVQFYFRLKGIPFHLVSRERSTKAMAYEDVDADLLDQCKLVVNTTPLGMHPIVDVCPNIPYALLNQSHTLIDLVYNPSETLFLKKGKAQGAVTHNGLQMLHAQADFAWGMLWKDSVYRRLGVT